APTSHWGTCTPTDPTRRWGCGTCSPRTPCAVPVPTTTSSPTASAERAGRLDQRRRESLRVLDVRRVPARFEDDLLVPAARRRVPVEDGPGLRHHRLGRALLRARPARYRAEAAQVREVEQRGVRDDDVRVAADPGDRRLAREIDDPGEVEPARRHGVEHAAG